MVMTISTVMTAIEEVITGTTARLTVGEREVLVKTAAMLVATVLQTTVAQCIAGKRPNSETDFPGAIIWMVQPPR